MIRLLIPTGGRPLKNEDVQLYEQQFDNLEAYLEELGGGDPIVIQGMEITAGAPEDIAAGVIYYDGSLCSFAGVASVSTPYVMEKVETDINAREFFDTVTRYTAEERTVEADGGGGLSYDSSTLRLSDFMREAANTAEVKAGVSPKSVTTSGLAAKDGGLLTEIVEIPNWDMDADATKAVAHGVTDHTKIREVTVIIKPDIGVIPQDMYDLKTAKSNVAIQGGIDSINTVNVVLFRLGSGEFDNIDFDSVGGFVRGWIVIRHVN